MGLVNILVSTVPDGICASDMTMGSVSLAGALVWPEPRQHFAETGFQEEPDYSELHSLSSQG